jgi:hypothetical protein
MESHSLADLVGPRRLVEGKVELKKRSDSSRELMTSTAAVERLTARRHRTGLRVDAVIPFGARLIDQL